MEVVMEEAMVAAMVEEQPISVAQAALTLQAAMVTVEEVLVKVVEAADIEVVMEVVTEAAMEVVNGSAQTCVAVKVKAVLERWGHTLVVAEVP